MTRRRLPPWFGKAFVSITFVLVLIFNSWAEKDGVARNTISAFITSGRAGFPFALGAITGHWMTADQSMPRVDLYGAWPTIAASVAILVADAATGHRLADYPFWVWLHLGIAWGAVMWTMKAVPA